MSSELHRLYTRIMARLPGRIRGRVGSWLSRRRTRRWNRLDPESSFVYWPEPGVRMRLYRDSELSRLIYCRGFEFAERRLVRRILKPADVFVDVGANVGLYTLIAADAVGDQGHVYAFEPVTSVFARLEENVQMNRFSNVSLSAMALSDDNGERAITFGGGGFDAWSSLGRPYMGEPGPRELVSTTTWDSFSQQEELDGRVTLMKIDVEGWELRVLRGSSLMLSRIDAPALLVEFTEQAAEAAGSSCEELYEELLGFGYELFLPDIEEGRLRRFDAPDGWRNVNLFAVKNVDWLWQRLDDGAGGVRDWNG